MIKKIFPESYFILLLAITIFLPFAPLLFSGQFFIDTGMVYNDMTSFYFALKDWYKSQLLSGQFPFWTNLVGNGYPVFAEGQTAVLYPFNLLLYLLLPTIIAFNLNLFLHFLLAAIFTYLFLRISLNLSRSASLIGALTYSLSGFFFARISYVHMIFVIAYFPLDLLLIERIVSKGKIKFSLFLAIIYALQILAGHTEMFFYCLFFSLGYLGLLLLTKKGPKRNLAIILTGLSLVLAFFICTIQLMPNWELVQNSHRVGGFAFETATASVWPLSALSLFINPRALDKYSTSAFSVPTVYGYIGLISLALAFLAATLSFKKRDAFIFTILAIFAFLWAQGRLSQVFAILWQIVPGVKFFRAPVKVLFALEFFLAVLAGIGLDWLRKRPTVYKNTSLRFVIVFDILMVLLVYGDLFYNNRGLQITVSAKDWFSPPPVVSFLKGNLDTVRFQIYSHGTNNMDFQTTKDPKLQKDFQNILPPNLNMPFGIPANRENFALFLKRQQEINKENTILDLENKVLRLPATLKQSLALQGVKYLLTDVPIEDPDLKLVLEIPFSEQVDHMAPLKSGQTARIKVDKTHVYENKKVYPRILFVNRTRDLSGKNDEEVLNTILSPSFNPTEEVILQESTTKERTEGIEQGAKIEVGMDKESEMEIGVKTETSGFLVLAQTYYPGWQAFIDGKPTKIYRANYAFQAVSIPQGEHLIKLVFEPTYWRLGWGITVGALITTLLGLGYAVFKNK